MIPSVASVSRCFDVIVLDYIELALFFHQTPNGTVTHKLYLYLHTFVQQYVESVESDTSIVSRVQ